MISLGYCEETIAMMELGLCEGIGPVVGKHLIQYFGSAQGVFQATKIDWQGLTGLSTETILDKKTSQDKIKQTAFAPLPSYPI